MIDLEPVLKELLFDLPVQNRPVIPPDYPEQRKLMRMLMNVHPPRQFGDQFLAAQDCELQVQLSEKGIVRSSNLLSNTLNPSIVLWQGDITCLEVDAIVNAANSQMLGCFSPFHHCIDNAIHSAAGVQLRMECYRLMEEQGFEESTGSAKITQGYNLPAKYIIHTVGPVVESGNVTSDDESLLASCYQSCLLMADKHKLTSVAFCCVSTGVFGFPNHKAAEIATQTVLAFLENNKNTSVEKVIFNVFKDLDYDIYSQLLCRPQN